MPGGGKNLKINKRLPSREGNRVQFEFNEQMLQIVQNLSSVLSNHDPSEANNFCDGLTAKLRCRNKLINIADRSTFNWATDAEYETNR